MRWKTYGTIAVLPFLLFGLVAGQVIASDETHDRKSSTMPHQATGSFTVQITPQAPDVGHESTAVGRMTLDKTFEGDLAGASLGQMLAFRSAVDGSAGYVAMERVSGTLAGREGSFTLQHSGTMAGGDQHAEITVVPDSGTEGLVGLAGTMTIRIEDGGHFYDFEYTLPE
ncbi:MAG: DUF3224 domain-containing protein [Acidobacteriota bacterium]